MQNLIILRTGKSVLAFALAAAMLTASAAAWDEIIDGTTNEVSLVSMEGNESILVTNGGALRATGWASSVRIGREGHAGNNTLVVDGPDSWLEAATGAYIGRGTDYNQLILRNGAAYTNLNTANWDMFDMVGWDGGSHNSLLIEGNDTTWLANNRFYVGRGAGSDNNTVTISNGAALFIKTALGMGSGADNEITVADNSLLDLEGYANLGGGGDGNVLRIASGSVLTNHGGTTYFRIRGRNNHLIFEGTDTRGHIAGEVWLGHDSDSTTNNLLAVRDGAQFTAGDHIYVGQNPASSANRVEVQGDDSLLTVDNDKDLFVGGRTDDNEMLVADGGAVHARRVYLGHNDGHNNLAEVKGSGSLVSLTEDLRIGSGAGAGAAGNEFRVSDGGVVEAQTLYVGLEGGHDNLLEISGTGSRVTTSQDSHVGQGADGNELRVLNGGSLDARYIRVGDDGGRNNRAEFDGTETAVTSTHGLRIGHGPGADDNRVVLSGGAVYTNLGSAYWLFDMLGFEGGRRNELVIDGEGTAWNANNRLLLGWANDVEIGVDNTVTVTNQGKLSVDGQMQMLGASNRIEVVDGGSLEFDGSFVFIGSGASASHAELAVSGAGSSIDLTMSGNHDVDIGRNESSHNRLLIADGAAARVYTEDIRVGSSRGDDPGGDWNVLEVTGGASLDVVDGSIYVGSDSSHNIMTVSAGGETDVANQLVVGQQAAALSNRLFVTGGELDVQNELRVGGDGSHSLMSLSAAGQLVTWSDSYIGHGEARDNTALVSGAGTKWESHSTIYVGHGNGEASRLEVSDGAVVESSDMDLGANGTILLDGGDLVSGLVIREGGTLQGDGEIYGAVDSAGVIAPGQSAGSLQFWSSLTLQDTSLLVMEIYGSEPAEYDRILGDDLFVNTMTLGGTLQVSFVDFAPEDGDTFTLFENWDLAGEFSDYDLQDPGAGLAWDTTGIESDGTLTVIPEPASALFLALGGAILVYLRRRR